MAKSESITGLLTRIADLLETSKITKEEHQDSDQLLPPPAIVRYIKLPDKLEKGNFDQYGNKIGENQPAALVLYPLGGPWQCWGVFDQPLEPGQFAYLTFVNVAGQAVPGGAFTEWHRLQSEPFFTNNILRMYSVQRAPGSARIIGRNDSNQRVNAAAGLLFVPSPGR